MVMVPVIIIIIIIIISSSRHRHRIISIDNNVPAPHPPRISSNVIAPAPWRVIHQTIRVPRVDTSIAIVAPRTMKVNCRVVLVAREDHIIASIDALIGIVGILLVAPIMTAPEDAVIRVIAAPPCVVAVLN